MNDNDPKAGASADALNKAGKMLRPRAEKRLSAFHVAAAVDAGTDRRASSGATALRGGTERNRPAVALSVVGASNDPGRLDATPVDLSIKVKP